jgi:hypothetical protein
MVNGNRRGATWWLAGLWEFWMSCGSGTFFVCGEGCHTGGSGDGGVRKLQARGLLDNIDEGGEDVSTSIMLA